MPSAGRRVDGGGGGAMPGVPTLTITTGQIGQGEWELRR
jgi:hypothetical protein